MSAAPCCGGALEGAPFSFGLGGNPADTPNPLVTIPAGESAYVAAPGMGVAFGRFCFADPATGFVSNARSDPGQIQGIAIVEFGTWQKVYWDDATQAWWLRPGLAVTVASQGDLWMEFPGGAVIGAAVYASPVDGTAYSGNTAGCEQTRFVVASNCGPGDCALITSWSSPI